MKFVVVLFICSSCLALQSNHYNAKAIAHLKNDTIVYPLPYEKGTSHLVAQGYHSFFSHHRDYAIDFKMKQGTNILAARSGVVVFVRDNETTGGVAKRFSGHGNGITIRHADGTYAHYWHLQFNGVRVSVGDSVSAGQWIALSGNTGFSAFPHLHFEVTEGPHKHDGDFPVPFFTSKGVQFLQPLHWYKAQ